MNDLITVSSLSLCEKTLRCVSCRVIPETCTVLRNTSNIFCLRCSNPACTNRSRAWYVCLCHKKKLFSLPEVANLHPNCKSDDQNSSSQSPPYIDSGIGSDTGSTASLSFSYDEASCMDDTRSNVDGQAYKVTPPDFSNSSLPNAAKRYYLLKWVLGIGNTARRTQQLRLADAERHRYYRTDTTMGETGSQSIPQHRYCSNGCLVSVIQPVRHSDYNWPMQSGTDIRGRTR